MSESLGPRKKDWDFSSTLKTLLDRHTLELSNEEFRGNQSIPFKSKRTRDRFILSAIIWNETYSQSFIQHFNILSGSVTTHELKRKKGSYVTRN